MLSWVVVVVLGRYACHYSYDGRPQGKSLVAPCHHSTRYLGVPVTKCYGKRARLFQNIYCSKESNETKRAGKLFLPNVRYYLMKNASSSVFPQLPLRGKPTDEVLGSTKKVLLDHRGVVYAQRSTLNAEKEHIPALDSHSDGSTKSSFGILSVDTDLNVTPTSSWLPQAPVASLCTTKKGVVLGVLQSADDEEYIPVLWMASTGTCIENTECFLVGISLIDLKRFQEGILDQLVGLFATQFQVEAKNLRVLVGMTPSMRFPRVSGKQILDLLDSDRYKLSRQFQIVHMVGKKHTEQLVVSKKRNNVHKLVLARKTYGSIQWKVDISRLVVERLKYLGTVVLNSTFPVSLVDNNIHSEQGIESNKQTEIQLTETFTTKNILSAAISIPPCDKECNNNDENNN